MKVGSNCTATVASSRHPTKFAMRFRKWGLKKWLSNEIAAKKPEKLPLPKLQSKNENDFFS